MFSAREIYFKSRSVLTVEMLDSLYRLPKNILKIFYDEFGDGIISGLNFRKENKEIFLTAGIIKSGNKFYFSENENFNLSKFFKDNRPEQRGNFYTFAFCRLPKKLQKGVDVEELELKIIPKKNLESAENIVLNFGSFNDECFDLILPETETNFKNFADDFLDEANNFSILEIPFSQRGGTTFHPYIFKAVKNILEQKTKKTSADIAFLMQIQQNSVTSFDVIKTYVEANCGKKILPLSDRTEIFKNMAEALKVIPSSKENFVTVSSQNFSTDDNAPISSRMIED